MAFRPSSSLINFQKKKKRKKERIEKKEKKVAVQPQNNGPGFNPEI